MFFGLFHFHIKFRIILLLSPKHLLDEWGKIEYVERFGENWHLYKWVFNSWAWCVHLFSYSLSNSSVFSKSKGSLSISYPFVSGFLHAVVYGIDFYFILQFLKVICTYILYEFASTNFAKFFKKSYSWSSFGFSMYAILSSVNNYMITFFPNNYTIYVFILALFHWLGVTEVMNIYDFLISGRKLSVISLLCIMLAVGFFIHNIYQKEVPF